MLVIIFWNWEISHKKQIFGFCHQKKIRCGNIAVTFPCDNVGRICVAASQLRKNALLCLPQSPPPPSTSQFWTWLSLFYHHIRPLVLECIEVFLCGSLCLSQNQNKTREKVLRLQTKLILVKNSWILLSYLACVIRLSLSWKIFTLFWCFIKWYLVHRSPSPIDLGIECGSHICLLLE